MLLTSDIFSKIVYQNHSGSNFWISQEKVQFIMDFHKNRYSLYYLETLHQMVLDVKTSFENECITLMKLRLYTWDINRMRHQYMVLLNTNGLNFISRKCGRMNWHVIHLMRYTNMEHIQAKFYYWMTDID